MGVGSRVIAAAGLVALSGCYRGQAAPPDGAATDGMGGGGSDGSDGDQPESLCEGAGDIGPSPLPRLTRGEYRRAVRDLLGVDVDVSRLPGDARIGPFALNVSTTVAIADVLAYNGVAESAAATAVGSLDALLPCDDGDTSNACASEFISQLGRRTFRRPLTDDQHAGLVATFEHGRDTQDFAYGIELVISAMLQDPNFLYRIELGTPDPEDDSLIALDDFEVATRMSLLLWGSIPDDELLDAAAEGALATSSERRAQAERMLADARAREGVGRIYTQWFGAQGVAGQPKDLAVFPEFNAALASDMEREVAATAAAMVLDDGAGIDTLLTSPRSLVTAELAAFYGVTVSEGTAQADGLYDVELPADERAGLLTRAGVMARLAHTDQTAPVLRGRFVLESIMCQTMPEPPADVDNTLPEVDPNSAGRERFEQHRADPQCGACHDLLDPVGFAFEHYDGSGKFRTQDGNSPVDASGELEATVDANGPFSDALELSELLAGSTDVRVCAVRQHATIALARALDVAGEDQCMLEELSQAFEDSDYELSSLLVAIVSREDFAARKIAPAAQAD